MEKQKKSVGTVALVVLLLIVTIVSLVLATYAWAKYTTTYNNTEANAIVAKWNVTGNSGNLQFNKVFTHVITPNKLAPGTNGTIPVSLDVTGTEVDVYYTMTLVSATNKPTNLKFYATRTGNGTTDSPYVYTNPITENVAYKTDTLQPGSTTVDGTIYWDWPYETKVEGDSTEGDLADTTNGKNPQTMTVSVNVYAKQVQPE